MHGLDFAVLKQRKVIRTRHTHLSEHISTAKFNIESSDRREAVGKVFLASAELVMIKEVVLDVTFADLRVNVRHGVPSLVPLCLRYLFLLTEL
jgi:hypothetical protein